MADDANDFLNPDEIDALLNSANETPEGDADEPDAAGTGDSGTDGPQAATHSNEDELLDPGEIDELIQNQEKEGSQAANEGANQADTANSSESAQARQPAKNPSEQTIDQAQKHLEEALGNAVRMSDPVAQFGSPAPFALESFDKTQRPAKSRQPLEMLQDVELDLRIELGRTEMLIEEVVELKEGSVVTLDKLAGDPVDILVNGRLIARGEVLVLNDNFCVRVGEILTPDV